jgi:hypothetical protein
MMYNPIYLLINRLPPFPSKEWEPAMALISRTVFSRAWIIQEIAVSRAVNMYCGLIACDFFLFAKGARFLAKSSWIKVLHTYYSFPGQAGYLTAIFNCTLRHYLGQEQSLQLLLASTRRFKSAREVDKIFALVGLSRTGSTSHWPEALMPDYGKPSESVYLDVTYYLISEGSLDVLSGIEDRTVRKMKCLPSWVPDYSVHQVVSILAMPPAPRRLTVYAAASPMSTKATVDSSDPNVLLLEGHNVDVVSTIADGPCTGDIIRSLRSWIELFDAETQYPSGASAFDAFGAL